ncbi:MAG TPA: 3-deoxy-manno-octulosonate cytidylyltransferase, partial [Phycisphaerales bacterium]|nr:3-deoxy-manno-octulosonate cytidylyltransferase [Phycisphaerales bacterium]
MSAVAIIPARLGSTRFPRKALASETGKPMVVHVCERAAQAESVGRVVVATDAEEIAGAVRGHGFEAVLTGEHENG